MLTRRRGVTNVKVALVLPETKLTLLVVKPAHGADWNCRLEPQLITPLGYWPFSGWFWPLRSSNVTVRPPPPGWVVGVGWTVGVGVAPAVVIVTVALR